jgi:ribose 5-phosphate isomerase B
MKVAIGCDHAAVELREAVMKKLEAMGHEVLDFGTHSHESVDYPDFGQKVSRAVQSGEAELGVLICGTGIGMSIVANKFRGIRAALCSESFSAHMSRRHNNANVLVMGARTIGVGLAEDIVESFFSDKFEGGRHARRVDKITVIEEKERS